MFNDDIPYQLNDRLFYFNKNMSNLKKYLILAKNKFASSLFTAVLLLILANIFFSPVQALADDENVNGSSTAINYSYQLAPENQGLSLIKIVNPGVISDGSVLYKDSHLPQNKGLEAKSTVNVVLTAYNSDVGQTDDSPCITANGFDLCKHGLEDTVAINGVKLGTKVRFPDLFGNKVFVVRDRMNSRYGSNHVDVWMLSKANAITFGVKGSRMDILE
jgi:3D (Asp-Asp-Asp) domain-containing protein